MAGEQAQAQEFDPLALERQVCFALSAASRSIVAAYRPVLEPLGLSHPQYLVMLALWGSRPLSLRTLSAKLRLEPATVSPLVRRLEAAGLVARSRREDDERTLDITLTERGVLLRAEALHVPRLMAARLGLELAELEDLQRLMTRVLDAADRSVGE